MMEIRIEPGGRAAGEATVPGDKSIAHRLLILASTATGASRILRPPLSLDLLATARCLAALSAKAGPSLEEWARKAGGRGQRHGFTWDGLPGEGPASTLVVEAEGRDSLEPAPGVLYCGNSGTTMRLLSGVAASLPFKTTLTGDDSLHARPMERVAAPLRAMGANVRTTEGHAPIEIAGSELHGILHRLEVPSAQVKGCVLLAGLAAKGATVVEEPATTRDHTERALAALGAPVVVAGRTVRISRFQHTGFEAAVPGDVSSAAFLVAAAALTGSELVVEGVGLNPTRTRFLEVMDRMGVRTERTILGEELGEPVGQILVRPVSALAGIRVEAAELPLIIDEVPVLAILAAHASGESRFIAAAELRVKESDRLSGLAEGIRGLGGDASVDGDDLVVSGGGLAGGSADSRGDHRMAMALTVGAMAGTSKSVIRDIEAADVSFPGFVPTLRRLGARIEG